MAFRYVFRGKTYDHRSLSAVPAFHDLDAPAFALGPALGPDDVKTVHVFERQTLLEKWIEANGRAELRDALAGIRAGVRRARTAERGDQADLRRRQTTLAARIADDLRDLAGATGLPANSRRLFLRATSKSSVLEGAVFDPAWVFTGANFTGSSLGATVPLPDLSWFPGMNNSITSLHALGICILHSNTWFRGASLWAVGAPYIGIANLAAVVPTFGALPNFNNATSSLYAYAY